MPPAHPALQKIAERRRLITRRLAKNHPAARRALQLSAIGGLLLFSQPNRPFLPPGTVKSRLAKYGFSSADEVRQKLQKIQLLVPSSPGTISPSNQPQIAEIIKRTLGIEACQTLDGQSLNYSFGWIGSEQHLKRFPGDRLSGHREILAGMAPGLGAWGYFTLSENSLSPKDILKERYYLAAQTMYLSEWNRNTTKLKEWYKYRKVIAINPANGKAAVAVIADAGPAFRTGKQFGGSPELMSYLELDSGRRRGKVLLWFTKNDPPIGPVESHIKITTSPAI